MTDDRFGPPVLTIDDADVDLPDELEQALSQFVVDVGIPVVGPPFVIRRIQIIDEGRTAFTDSRGHVHERSAPLPEIALEYLRTKIGLPTR